MWYWEREQLPLIDFFTPKRPTANKEHECGECKEIIELGSTYKYYSGRIEGGGVFSFKMCLPCCRDWSAVLKVFDENLEYWEHPEMVFGLLNVAARELLRAGFIDVSHQLVGRWLPNVEQPKVSGDINQLSLALK